MTSIYYEQSPYKEICTFPSKIPVEVTTAFQKVLSSSLENNPIEKLEVQALLKQLEGLAKEKKITWNGVLPLTSDMSIMPTVLRAQSLIPIYVEKFNLFKY